MNQIIFNGLFSNWKARNNDLYFYFNEIFGHVVNNIQKNAVSDNLDIERYKAIFLPVGFSIENVALVSSAFKLQLCCFAMSDSARSFHRNHIHMVEEQIKKHNPSAKITSVTIPSDDQMNVEQKIVEWVEEMKNIYGIPYREMAIDLTGGTKPMSIGAHNAAMSYDEIDAFYLRTDYDFDTKQPIPGTERLIKVKKTRSQVDEKMVFVAMPFKDEFKDIYETGILLAINELGMKCVRVDEQVFTGPIVDKINDNILKANVIVAEITEYNPNVFYELGLAHGYNKKVIMLTLDISSIPFDLRHLRIVKYETGNIGEFKEQFKKEIISICS